MVDATQLKKTRRKPGRSMANTGTQTEDKPINSYFYPKNNLYTRQEFELLDTIYSDDPPGTHEHLHGINIDNVNNFWPQNKEEHLSIQKSNPLKNLIWFTGGVILTSVIWFTFFQVKVNEIRTKDNTKIVYHKTAPIITDKTADKELAKSLGSQDSKLLDNQIVLKQEKEKVSQAQPWISWFNQKPKQQVIATNQVPSQIKYYTVSNGDSLWIVAGKYYSNPSPDNINKLIKANNLKLSSILQPGQKLVIPL